MRQSIVDRRSVGWCCIGRHSDLNVWVEVESVAVASGPSVPGLPAWELDSVKVTEKVAWAPASVSDLRFDAAPSSSVVTNPAIATHQRRSSPLPRAIHGIGKHGYHLPASLFAEYEPRLQDISLSSVTFPHCTWSSLHLIAIHGLSFCLVFGGLILHTFYCTCEGLANDGPDLR